MSLGVSVFVIGLLAFSLVIAILVIFTGLPKPIEHALVRSWREELERHNVQVSTHVLEHALETVHGKSEDVVPFELIFSDEDYQSLISRIFEMEEENSRQVANGYKKHGIPKDNVASAIYVKQLLDYIKTLQESKRLIGSEHMKNKWSEEAREKWNMLEMEEEESEGMIRSIIRPMYLKGDLFKLSFSNEGILSEKERLMLVDKKLEGAKPHFSMGDSSSPVSSPALVEINEFLNKNELPQDVEKELKQTMTKIQEKLRVQTKHLEKENVIQNATLLNTAAKDFHELS